MKRTNAGTVILACAVALIGSLLAPFGLSMAMLLVPGTIVSVVLYAWAGWIPALAHMACSALSMGLFYGAGGVGLSVVLSTAPSLIVIELMRRKAPYFRRMRAAIVAQLGAMVALVFIMWIIMRQMNSEAQDLAELMVLWFRGGLEQLPEAMQALVIQQFAAFGIVGDELGAAALAGTLSTAQIQEALASIYDMFGSALRLGMPAMLASSGIITGLLAVLCSGAICDFFGDDLEYIPIDQWYVPKQVIYGALAALATALIIQMTGVSGSEAVVAVVFMALRALCAVAGVAALSRRMKAIGRGPNFRFVMILLGLIFAANALVIIGALSMLVGSKGVLSTFIKKKMDEHKEDDDL